MILYHKVKTLPYLGFHWERGKTSDHPQEFLLADGFKRYIEITRIHFLIKKLIRFHRERVFPVS
jgi:hypothetical protein